jgi:uncharacterized lipoprotein YmbA
MTDTITARLWLIVGLCLSLAGCGLTTPRPEVHHYTLALRVADPTASAAKATLVVRPLSAHDPYNQERLVYRSSPYQLDFYNSHRWAAAPTEQVAEWTRQYLRSAGLFSAVSPTGDGMADFTLNGRIRQCDEVDHDNTWEAILSVDFWLTRSDQRTPLWFHTYTATQTTAKRHPSAIAEAMSHNLETILGRLAGDLAPVVAAQTSP